MKVLVTLAIIVAWLLEALLAKALFITPFVLIGVALGAIVAAFAQYLYLFDALYRGHLAFIVNLVFTPLIGMLLGFLITHAAAPAMIADKSEAVSVPLVLAIIAAVYGTFVAPFLAPKYLLVNHTVISTVLAWSVAFLSFICIAYAWGLMAVAIHLHLW